MNDFNSYNGYNTNSTDYTNNQSDYGSNSSGFTNDRAGYNQSLTGYNNNQSGYSQTPTGYNNNQSGYNQNSTGYNNNQSGYNQTPTGYNNNQSGYNQTPTGYANNQSGYSQTPTGYSNNQNGYANYYSNYVQAPLGYYPNQPNTLANSNRKKVKVSFNSPVVLWFAIVCLIALIVEYITDDMATYYLFSVYRSSLLDPLTYVRFFGHALGHADIEHYMGNMMTLLIVGPLLEEKYGSKSILLVMTVTAFVTGVVNFIFCPDAMTLGASGIVFAFILLSSLTCMREGEIPLTFILVAVLYLGEQILEAAFVESNISNISHIVGGICGCILGYYLNKNKTSSNNNSTDNTNNTGGIGGGGLDGLGESVGSAVGGSMNFH